MPTKVRSPELDFIVRDTSHPAYAYVSYGVSNGGYVSWPADLKLAN